MVSEPNFGMSEYEFENRNDDDDENDPTSFSKIIKPEICDVLVSTELSRNPWSSEENKRKRLAQSLNKDKQMYDSIMTFKNTFYNINNRYPLDSEILDNLKDKYDIGMLTKIMDQINKNVGITSSINSFSETFTASGTKLSSGKQVITGANLI